MLEFVQNDSAPHLKVRCGESIVFGDLVETAPALEQAIERLGPAAVITFDASRLEAIDPEAVGVLCYLVLCAFRTSPRLVVVAAQDVLAATPLCAFARRMDTEGRLRVVACAEELREAVEEFADA